MDKPQPSRLHIPLKYAMSPDATVAIAEDGTEMTTVYTSRRALTQLMEAYYTRYDFALNISRCNGSLYIIGNKAANVPQNLAVNHIRMEQIFFSDSPHEMPKKNVAYNRNFGLSGLHRTTLGKYDVIYAGEVQGIIAQEEFHNFEDLEALNKLRFVFTKQMYHNNKNKDAKLLTYWIQAYLAHVDDIYLAVKNYDGVIEKPIEHIKVSNIPKNCISWKPQVCVGLLNEFLGKVEELMASVNSLDTVYGFNFNVKDKTFYYNVYEGKTEKSFIPQEYVKFMAEEGSM